MRGTGTAITPMGIDKQKIPYFDGHCDSVYRCMETGENLLSNGGHVALDRLGGFSAYGQVFALFYDGGAEAKLLPVAKRLYETFLRQTDLAAGKLVHCRTGAEISAAVEQGAAAGVLSIEGGELLDCDPDNLALAEAWGVRLINPTWNYGNALSGSHRHGSDRGLTDRGRTFVRDGQRAGILTDVSHLSERGFWDLMKITEVPVVASHSNSAAVFPHSRSLTDKQFAAIAECGGVVGLNLYSHFVGSPDTMDMLVRHLEHFLELGGEHTIALGADFDGCEEIAGDIGGIQGIPKLYMALQLRGWDEALLKKLFWDNWIRLLK